MNNSMNLAIVFYTILFLSAAHKNNVCKTLADYWLKNNNTNCRYNPDVTATATELIVRYGYPIETYEVVTEDFYILTMYRIPPINRDVKGIVFLQHPATASCTVWIDIGNVSFAFMLADAGYDVWLPNARGTIYSEKHLNLSPDSKKYWNFSFHEMGIYDLPAEIDFVRRKTDKSKKLFFIGHSMGTTSALIYASLKPEHAKENIKLFMLWTPMATLKYLTTPLRLLAPFMKLIARIAELTNQMSFIPHNGILHKLIKAFCTTPITMRLCFFKLQWFTGKAEAYFDPERLPLIVSQNFAGVSFKSCVHYSQIINSGGHFRQYDYGRRANRQYYGSETLPLYPIQNIIVPVYFMYGIHDAMADEKDVVDFYSQLPLAIKYGIRRIEEYGHIDFAYGKKVEDIVYKPTIEIMEQM